MNDVMVQDKGEQSSGLVMYSRYILNDLMITFRLVMVNIIKGSYDFF